MTKKEILRKAENILFKKESERFYLKKCLKAGICPECGEIFIVSNYKCKCGWKKEKRIYGTYYFSL